MVKVMNQCKVHGAPTADPLDRNPLTGGAKRTFQEGLVMAIATLYAEPSQNRFFSTASTIDYL
ncbi:MAG: hypothetical protein A2168_07050 [Planctomycetes bacterium RBG_13_50_24]|nr:MAG: hypothetical protein A2168_07050 [Planctomycetes bacterium RBG_13_50_24]